MQRKGNVVIFVKDEMREEGEEGGNLSRYNIPNENSLTMQLIGVLSQINALHLHSDKGR